MLDNQEEKKEIEEEKRRGDWEENHRIIYDFVMNSIGSGAMILSPPEISQATGINIRTVQRHIKEIRNEIVQSQKADIDLYMAKAREMLFKDILSGENTAFSVKIFAEIFGGHVSKSEIKDATNRFENMNEEDIERWRKFFSEQMKDPEGRPKNGIVPLKKKKKGKTAANK